MQTSLDKKLTLHKPDRTDLTFPCAYLKLFILGAAYHNLCSSLAFIIHVLVSSSFISSFIRIPSFQLKRLADKDD